MTNPVVVDLSHWQPDPIDWDVLKACGTVGVILKATQGTTYVDPTWIERAQAAIAAGLKVATYHFLVPGGITDQMAFYIAEQDKVMPPGSRVCLDHEDPDVSLDDLEDAVYWLVTNRPDLQITVYSGHVIKDQLIDCDADFLGEYTSLWIAHYASTPTWPEHVWSDWSLWQFSDQVIVDGVTVLVDGNKFNGAEDTLIEWFGPPAPSIPEVLERPRVVINIEAPPGVDVVVYVNGEEEKARTARG